MSKVLTYLREKYKRTGFPFTTLTEITNLFGQEGKDELNKKLYKQGIVTDRKGANDKIIEYSPINDNHGINR
jgi:hypothetical protein